MSPKERYIVHVDMDAFFASVEQRDNPSYRGKPVIVGSDPKGGRGRGVVAACSYEARKFGIHSALPISIAYRKCPDAVFLTPDMSRYAESSHKIFDILERFTPDIEPISVDEAFMDITGSWQLFGSPLEVCKKIKCTIKKELDLIASVGMAPNKMTAKIASDIDKPDGLVVVTKEHVLDFLHPLPVGKLWGVGEKMQSALARMGINTIGDLARHAESDLEDVFGKNGQHVWELSNGIDVRDVETSTEIKSISNEYTFETDTSERKEVLDALMYLSEKVSRRLREDDTTGRTITLKIRSSAFKTYTRAITLGSYTNFVEDIYESVVKKLDEFDLVKMKVRLLGVKVSNLSFGPAPLDLFSGTTDKENRKERIHKAIDNMINKFGAGAIRRRC